jgi:hypothetical protein
VGTLNAALIFAMMGCVTVVLVESVRAWRRSAAPAPA